MHSVSGDDVLRESNRAALQHVRDLARSKKEQSLARISAVLHKHSVQILPQELIRLVLENAAVAIHFHPDRHIAPGLSVAQSLLQCGTYKSQFETQISNGGLSAFKGGDRYLWEDRLFGGVYNEAPAAERPRYGALDLLRHSDGPAPRFGSCYFRLKRTLLSRCTFSVGDSSNNPEDRGTFDEFESVLAGLLERISAGTSSLGREPLTVPSFVERVRSASYASLSPACGRALDDYIEVQIHHVLSLPTDFELLVADPSFRNSCAGAELEQLAMHYSIPLIYHNGFQLSFDAEISPEFRGPAIPLLAQRLRKHYKHNGNIHVELVGRAAVSVVQNPQHWEDWGPPAQCLQHLKQLWHVLVWYGEPYSSC